MRGASPAAGAAAPHPPRRSRAADGVLSRGRGLGRVAGAGRQREPGRGGGWRAGAPAAAGREAGAREPPEGSRGRVLGVAVPRAPRRTSAPWDPRGLSGAELPPEAGAGLEPGPRRRDRERRRCRGAAALLRLRQVPERTGHCPVWAHLLPPLSPERAAGPLPPLPGLAVAGGGHQHGRCPAADQRRPQPASGEVVPRRVREGEDWEPSGGAAGPRSLPRGYMRRQPGSASR